MHRLTDIRCRARGEKLLDREGVELVRALAELAGHFDRALLTEHVPNLVHAQRAQKAGHARLTATARELHRRALEHADVALAKALFQQRLERGADEITRPDRCNSALGILPSQCRWRALFH